jgi:hypothetical protein
VWATGILGQQSPLRGNRAVYNHEGEFNSGDEEYRSSLRTLQAGEDATIAPYIQKVLEEAPVINNIISLYGKGV